MRVDCLTNTTFAVCVDFILVFDVFILGSLVLLSLVAKVFEICTMGSHACDDFFIITCRFDKILNFHRVPVLR